MTTFTSYIRLIVFIGAMLLGIQVPGFVDQYGKSLEAHFNESRLALAEFEDEAARYFGGDMEKLIAHYKRSGDQIFIDGGDSISAIYQRHFLLKSHLANFRQGFLWAYHQAVIEPLPDIQQEVRMNFTHVISLKADAIAFGLGAGLLMAILCELFLKGISALVRLPFKRKAVQ